VLRENIAHFCRSEIGNLICQNNGESDLLVLGARKGHVFREFSKQNFAKWPNQMTEPAIRFKFIVNYDSMRR
jgi:hypothetical protein